jgi:hypothetical protein
MLGNPYPSTSVLAFLTQNLYFWTPTKVRLQQGQIMLRIQRAGTAASITTNQMVLYTPDGSIAIGQGFY